MAQIITLESLLTPAAPATGCVASGCGSAQKPAGTSPAGQAPAGMDPAVWERVKDHPCYAEEAHHYFARMHVAVAPACNIQCNYCNRKYDCANESRPGVVSEKLTPEQAVRKVVAVANAVPQLSVLGVAGPGDAVYDWRHTSETFKRVQESIPDLRLCLSTNGLALPDHVEEIAAMGVDHVTITINFVDPEIGARIHPWIFFGHQRHTGVEAARIGLVHKAVAREKLDAEVEALADRMASVPVNQLMMQKLMINQAVEAMGLRQTQMFATIFDGVTRHSPEGYNFKLRAEEVGWKEAVRNRDQGTWDWTTNRPINPGG